METRKFAGWDVSRMTLGAAQFGMTYGIANRAGQPDLREIMAILVCAAEAGINLIDTAAAYGESEKVLGRALKETGLQKRMLVITKIKPLPPDVLKDQAAARCWITESVENSLKNLQLEKLPVVMFHREPDALHLDILQEQQNLGKIGCLGVSCDNTPEGALELVRRCQVQALQIPGNMLDRRHECSGLFEKSAETGTGLFLRSVFLQGLLLMPEETIPASLTQVVPVRGALADICSQAGITMVELSLRYALSQSSITSILTGVETVAQVRENVSMFGKGPLDPATLQAVHRAVPDLPVKILTPSMWSS